jgi:hypothetical protein
MNINLDDLHRRWLDTPCQPVIIDEIPDPEPPPHPQPTDPPPTAAAAAHSSGGRERDAGQGGSGTAGPGTREKDQAGSYARDAEQDPEGERHNRGDADR